MEKQSSSKITNQTEANNQRELNVEAELSQHAESNELSNGYTIPEILSRYSSIIGINHQFPKRYQNLSKQSQTFVSFINAINDDCKSKQFSFEIPSDDDDQLLYLQTGIVTFTKKDLTESDIDEAIKPCRAILCDVFQRSSDKNAIFVSLGMITNLRITLNLFQDLINETKTVKNEIQSLKNVMNNYYDNITKMLTDISTQLSEIKDLLINGTTEINTNNNDMRNYTTWEQLRNVCLQSS